MLSRGKVGRGSTPSPKEAQTCLPGRCQRWELQRKLSAHLGRFPLDWSGKAPPATAPQKFPFL